ncbi:Rhs protein [[Actinomadura] parvosata subsp. kistnae]|uniref:RHS repeat-associated core domain-containing protein n=1 Tax=[Actinomadura] parvosata TaxID=1955412 RepID=UPI000D2679FD|nr:Rhs protein [Actinomadura parvosata subsp. kistnae]
MTRTAGSSPRPATAPPSPTSTTGSAAACYARRPAHRSTHPRRPDLALPLRRPGPPRRQGTRRRHRPRRLVWDGQVLAEQTTTGRTTTWAYEPGTHRPLTQTERIPQEQIDQAFYAIAIDLLGTPSLHYDVFRHYAPIAAHYTSGDPLGLASGPKPYAFVHHPITAADPLGLAAYGGPGGKHVLDEQPAISCGETTGCARGTDRQGSLYMGGTGQIFIPKPWTIPGVEVLDSWPLH